MDSRSPQLRPRTMQETGILRGVQERTPDNTPSIRIKPLSQFPGDQVYAAGGAQTEFVLVPDAPYPYTLLRAIRGFRVVDVTGAVYVDINGGGTRKIKENDTFDFCTIWSIRFVVPAAGSVTLQQWGE